MIRLPARRHFEIDAEPGEILDNRPLEFRPAARLVDILDAQQQASAEAARHGGVLQRAQGMAEMQHAIRARREAQHGGLVHRNRLMRGGHDQAYRLLF